MPKKILICLLYLTLLSNGCWDNNKKIKEAQEVAEAYKKAIYQVDYVNALNSYEETYKEIAAKCRPLLTEKGYARLLQNRIIGLSLKYFIDNEADLALDGVNFHLYKKDSGSITFRYQALLKLIKPATGLVESVETKGEIRLELEESTWKVAYDSYSELLK